MEYLICLMEYLMDVSNIIPEMLNKYLGQIFNILVELLMIKYHSNLLIVPILMDNVQLVLNRLCTF